MAATPGIAQVDIDLTAVTAFTAMPNVNWPWSPRSASYVHMGADTPIYLSWDGVTIHATLTPGSAQAGIVVEQPQPGVWARAAAGGGTNVVLLATAEGQ